MNVRKAIPLFQGHYQPRVPLNGNYYCLLDDGVMEAQAELAKKYGIYGFCYYHYWFANGKKLLEQPLELMLHNPNVDIPFCLCWANENWTRTWDGGNNEIIIEQDYDDMDNLNRHIDYLCEFFADPRYIKHDGKPLFVIYRPLIIPNLNERIEHIRERVKANGFEGIMIVAQHPSAFDFEHKKCIDLFVDAYIQTQPAYGMISSTFRPASPLKENIKALLKAAGLLKPLKIIKNMIQHHEDKNMVFDYDTVWEQILHYPHDDKRLIAGAFKDYDDTPRRRTTGSYFIGAEPQKFRDYMKRLVHKVRNEYEYPYIFINAWNEWGEGSYLEPDERYGYEWLEALRDALNS